MEEKLRAYMDSIFREVKLTRQSVELKEEILQNLIDKYHDLIAEGKTPQAGYNISIASIGDINEILESMERMEPMGTQISQDTMESRNQKSAMLTSIAVMLYILSLLPPIFLQKTSLDTTWGPALMFIMIAIATGLLVYNYMTRPQYRKHDDTIVEDFKKWNNQSESGREAVKAISSALWSLTVVVYLLVSFATMAWHVTWVIFLIAAAIMQIIKATFALRGK